MFSYVNDIVSKKNQTEIASKFMPIGDLDQLLATQSDNRDTVETQQKIDYIQKMSKEEIQ